MKARVYSRIRDVPTAHWDALVEGRSIALARTFWEVLEAAEMPGFAYRYAVFTDANDQPVGFASLYIVTTDIAIFAPPALRGLLAAVRRIFPNFLKLRMLECGTPITVSSPPFGTKPGTDPHEFLAALNALLLREARANRQLIVVVRDFEADARPWHDALVALGYRSVPSLPNTYLEIPWTTPAQYLESMRSYYRSKLIRHLRRNAEAGVSHEMVDDFHDLAETLCAQWMEVHEHASEFQREQLTPGFYRELSQRLGGRAKALLFRRQGRLAGHALLLLDGDMLRWLYVGREAAINDGLYIYIAHKVVEAAILLGAKRLEMGLTTYSIKQDLGARVAGNRVVLKSSLRVVDPFITFFYGLLNRTPAIDDKDIFKTGASAEQAVQRTPTMRRRKNL